MFDVILQKNKNFFVSLLIALIIAPSAVAGQSVVYDLSPQASEFSIVRHYVNDVDITYSFYSNVQNCFCYIDRSSNEYYRANVSLSFRANDFRIYNDTVYFCGVYNSCSVIGWFDIAGLFFGGGDINYVSMPINLSTGDFHISGYDVYIEGFRLKVFEKNGDLHLVMVGKGSHRIDNKYDVDTSDRTTYTAYSAIIDMWTNNHISWEMRYTMDYTDDMSYDDIAVTDKYVVVTAHFVNPYHNYLGPQILYYSKPTTAGYSILNPTSLSSPIYAPGYWTDYDFILCQNGAPFLVAEMEGDKFVTACNALIENCYPATVVTYYNDPVSWPMARYKYDAGLMGVYNEINYNKYNKFLYLLRSNNYFLERIGPPFVDAEIVKMMSPDYSYMSFDVLDMHGTTIVSGFDSVDIMTLWKVDENYLNNCIVVNNVSAFSMSENRSYEPKQQYVQETLFSKERWRVSVKKYDLEITCE